MLGLGGSGGFDPKKMQAIMKQLGMSQEEIPASKVVIEKDDGEKIVIEQPSVTKIKVQGQETFQVSGKIKQENREEGFSEKDIATVMEKTKVTKEKAKKALEESGGDLAEAILNLG